jgi:hypothetical protein
LSSRLNSPTNIFFLTDTITLQLFIPLFVVLIRLLASLIVSEIWFLSNILLSFTFCLPFSARLNSRSVVIFFLTTPQFFKFLIYICRSNSIFRSSKSSFKILFSSGDVCFLMSRSFYLNSRRYFNIFFTHPHFLNSYKSL